ncbi:hypothetical protein ACHAXA_011383 [Cyclostephanos tholiformis]|uniref:Uncharacterized protein n=1 Tax=Cyclostephanos tholiformis TaxID=382380 RepID=A0ABD3RA38_9STRA
MPTVHYAKRKFLDENDLVIPWRIDVDESNRRADPSRNTQRNCAACASDHRRKGGNEIIFVRVGKTDHPAFEMIRIRDNTCTTHPIDPDDMMWIQWVTTLKIVGVSKQQLVEGGLQPRKRTRPNYFHDGG